MKLFHRSASPARCPEPLFDALEARLALYASPFLTGFPSVEEMASPQNTVVRIQTSAGIVDIELYDHVGPAISGGGNATAAPNTAANFLSYIRDGLYDGTFFHRLAKNDDDSGFVLQGGGFTFDEASTARAKAIPERDTVDNEFDENRSNLERTIAMAKLGNDPDSATNQFFFNLNDNGDRIVNGQQVGLDFQNGGFTVFGRVISGWDIIKLIEEFETRNLNTYMNAGINAFPEVPLEGSSNADVVTIIDADVVKPATAPGFFEYTLNFPDGFRSGNTTSTINLVNLEVNTQTHYEIIARYETGLRDTVIASGTLVPGAHLAVPVARAGDPSVNVVRGGAPFAIEVRTTNPVAATFEHRDFSAFTAQSFINPRDFTGEQLRDWTFALGQKGPGVPSYLVWQNLSQDLATLTITFTSGSGATHELVQRLEGSRRGGLNVNTLAGVPNGAYSVRITSDQPIVAALSQYRAAPGRAAIEAGAIGGPATQGVLPGALVPADGQSFISLVYSGAQTDPVVVDFEFVLASGAVHTSPALVTLSSTSRRADIDLSTAHAAIPTDEYFTIRYRVRDGVTPVAVSYLGLVGGRTMRTSFQTVSTQEVYFAGGFTDPSAAGTETISIYNPHTDPTLTVSYSIRFHFADGEGDEIVIPASASGQLDAGGMVNIDVRSLALVMQKINLGEQFRWYGISILAEIRDNASQETPGAIFAQYTRLDPGGRTATYGPTLAYADDFPRFFLTSPLFN